MLMNLYLMADGQPPRIIFQVTEGGEVVWGQPALAADYKRMLDEGNAGTSLIVFLASEICKLRKDLEELRMGVK